MFFDEAAAGFDFFAHESCEEFVCLAGDFAGDLEQDALVGIHGGFPELGGVHFAQTLEATDFHASAADFVEGIDDGFEVFGFDDVAATTSHLLAGFAGTGLGFIFREFGILLFGGIGWGCIGWGWLLLMRGEEPGVLGGEFVSAGGFFAFQAVIGDVQAKGGEVEEDAFQLAIFVEFADVSDVWGIGFAGVVGEFEATLIDDLEGIVFAPGEFITAAPGDAMGGEAVFASGIGMASGDQIEELAAAAFGDEDEFAESGEVLKDFARLIGAEAFDLVRVAAGVEFVGVANGELGMRKAQFGEFRFHQSGVEDVLPLDGAAGDLLDDKQGRLSDVDMATGDEFGHLAEEEGEEEGADVAAVHIGVGHDDDFLIAEFGGIEVVADAAAQGLDEDADFFKAQDFVEAGFFDVDDFAFEGEDGLILDVASLGGGATCGIAFDDEEFGVVALTLAIAEFGGHGAGFEGGFAAGEFAGLAGGLAGLGSDDALQAEFFGIAGVLFEPGFEAVVDRVTDKGLDLWIEEFFLGLIVEGGVGEFDTDDGGDAFAEVFATGDGVFFLDDAGFAGVGVEGAGEGGFEALAVGAAIFVVDVVGEGQEGFVVAIVILEGDFDGEVVSGVFFFQRDDGAHGAATAIEVFDVFGDTTFCLVGFVEDFSVGVDAFIGELEGDTGIEEGEFAEAIGEGVGVEAGVGKDLIIGTEGDAGAALAGAVGGDGSDEFEGAGAAAALEADGVDLAIAVDFAVEIFAEGVDAGDTHAVQAAGNLVGAAFLAELTTGVENGEDDFDGGLAVVFGLLVLDGVGGDAAAIIDD